ncbi:hypothetical protein ACWFNE_10165 [Cellulomonas sp. NPDC055163]
MERVLRGAIVAEISQAVAARVAAPHLLRTGSLPPHISVDLIADLEQRPADEWSELLDRLVESFGTPVVAASAGAQAIVSAYLHQGGQLDPTVDLMPGEIDEGSVRRSANDPHLLLAFSRLFLGRVEDWISRLLEEDIASALRADPPPPSIFLALEHRTSTRDEVGLWIWDRLTVTRIESWATSSLLLEWRMHRGKPAPGCPARILAERDTPADQVANLALERMSRASGRTHAARDLDPVHFTRRAAHELRSGRWQEAAAIFSALVELRPADGEAWNNLGFCQLAGDPATALTSLEKASFYERDQPIVNVANRCLALHLMGDNAAAKALAESSQHLRLIPARPAFMWIHHCGSELQLGESVELVPYFDRLYEHIAPLA